jgi:hypothetical protein
MICVNTRSRGPRRAAIISCSVILVCTGCSTVRLSDQVLGSSYQPTNVFRFGPRLPSDMRRVAVLPIVSGSQCGESQTGEESLQTVLEGELLKTRRFEMVTVPPHRLKEWTGRTHWAADDKLPQDFFRKLADQTGANAVLFAELTQFRAYPPLAVGWRLALVSCSDQRVWWAVDEQFDAGHVHVANGARRFQQTQQQRPGKLLDSTGVLLSPASFGQYAAATTLATLPPR